MSTRLILKNLPKNADEARVREHFKGLGDVTDVKVLRTKDGRSRCFGFVGFKDKQQAADARQYFDKSCMGSCRLEVSFAESYKSETTNRSEAAPAKEQHDAKSEQDNTNSTSAKASKREQQLQEFLGVNKHKSRQQMFANDEVNPEVDPKAAGEVAEDDGSDVSEQQLEEMSDMDYLQSRMGKLDSGAEVRNSEQDMPEAPSPADGRHQESDTQADAVALIGQTSKLFVRNLPFVTSDDDLLSLMKAYGEVEDVRVVRDKSTGASKGFALVQFNAAADAVAAFQALDGKAFQGRLIHIIPGKPSEQAPIPEGSEAEAPKKAGFKTERDDKRKANAGDKTAWSTFFMREDTVAQAVADLMGITKAELLDPEASDAAVRMALGETQVVAATKKELAESGVNIAALERAARASGHASTDSSVKRSPMVLLVKNLPSEATEDALEELFAKHGTVVRVLLPRTKALAIVEMSDEQGARRAFKRLAYKRFLHVPLYLEYAPEDVLEESIDQPKAGTAGKAGQTKSAPLTDADLVSADAPVVALENPDSHVATSTTLYIKNISFETSRATLEKHCKKAANAVGGVLRSVAVPSKKVDPSKKKPAGEELLQGFAFAEFGDQKTAEAALKRLQGAAVDGHKLQVEFSRTETGTSQKGATKRDRDASETKLMVRNLAFEATSKDVRQLMEAFGHVKTCRLPKKFDGTTRGFAFVEFATKGEAQKAMESTYGTHLYGRRLLLEFAKGEEGVSELRTKAQRVS